MDEIELRRTGQRLSHRTLRSVEDRDILYRADTDPVSLVNSAMTGFIGTRYGDQIIPLTSAFPTAFAAAMVCSSIVAARARASFPGRNSPRSVRHCLAGTYVAKNSTWT